MRNLNLTDQLHVETSSSFFVNYIDEVKIIYNLNLRNMSLTDQLYEETSSSFFVNYIDEVRRI